MGQGLLVVGLLIVAVLLAFFMFLSIAALILQNACATCGVEKPTFGGAMGIVFSTRMLISAIEGGIAFFASLAVGGDLDVQMQVLLFLIGIPVAAVVSAGVYSAMLTNCSLWKGFQVWFVEFLIYIMLVVVIGGVVLLIALAIP
jgi:hypothetical protein